MNLIAFCNDTCVLIKKKNLDHEAQCSSQYSIQWCHLFTTIVLKLVAILY